MMNLEILLAATAARISEMASGILPNEQGLLSVAAFEKLKLK